MDSLYRFDPCVPVLLGGSEELQLPSLRWRLDSKRGAALFLEIKVGQQVHLDGILVEDFRFLDQIPVVLLLSLLSSSRVSG